MRFSARAAAACSAGAALATGVFARRILQRDCSGDERSDTTARLPGVARQAPRTVRVCFRDGNGIARYARLDESTLSAEVERQLCALDEERVHLASCARAHLRSELSRAMQEGVGDVSARAGAFADWYFAYGTSYRLLQIASAASTSSAVACTVGAAGAASPSAAATSAVTAAINERYEALCLRPPLLEPALRRAFVSAAEATHADFLNGVEALVLDAHKLLEEHTDHTTPPSASGAGQTEVQVDWKFARARAGSGHAPSAARPPTLGIALAEPDLPRAVRCSPTARLRCVCYRPFVLAYTCAGRLSASFERPDLCNTATLLAADAIAGKIVAPKAAAAAAGQALGATSSKALVVKLASPVVAKALSGPATATAATSASATLSALSGPSGAVVGADVGVGIDYAVSAAAVKNQQVHPPATIGRSRPQPPQQAGASPPIAGHPATDHSTRRTQHRTQHLRNIRSLDCGLTLPPAAA